LIADTVAALGSTERSCRTSYVSSRFVFTASSAIASNTVAPSSSQ
jgi:hypothetical protein